MIYHKYLNLISIINVKLEINQISEEKDKLHFGFWTTIINLG